MGKLFVIFICLLSMMSTMFSNNIKRVDGEFYYTFEGTDEGGCTNTYYQFKSYDDEVWWFLKEDEIGYIPKSNTRYTFVYNDNGTTKEDNVCDCPKEYECECYLYDDEFIRVIEKG